MDLHDAPLGAHSPTTEVLGAIARGEYSDLPLISDSRRMVRCPHCAAGDVPYKMRRQTVHHFPSTGKIVVCVEASLKPGS